MRQLNRADAAFADTIFPFENELQQWPPGIGITSSRFFEFGDVQIMSCRHSIAIRHLTHRLSPAP